MNIKYLSIVCLIVLFFGCEKEAMFDPEEMPEEMQTEKNCILVERLKHTIAINVSTGETMKTTDTLPLIYDSDKNILAIFWDNNEASTKWDTFIYESQKPKFVNRFHVLFGEKKLVSETEKFYDENGLLETEVKTEFEAIRTIKVIDSFAYDNQILFKRSRIQEYYSGSELTARIKFFEEEYEFEDDNLITVTGKQFDIFDITRVTSTYTNTYSNYTTYKNPLYKTPIPDLFDLSLSKNHVLRIKNSNTNGSSSCTNFSDEGANEYNYPITEGKYECN